MSEVYYQASSEKQEGALFPAHEMSQHQIALPHEFSLLRSEIRAGFAEYRVLMVIVGAAIIAAAAAMKYPG